MENYKKTNDLFSKKFLELNQQPDLNGWAKLEKELPLKKSKKPFLFLIIPLLLLFFIGVKYDIFISQNNIPEKVNSNPKKISKSYNSKLQNQKNKFDGATKHQDNSEVALSIAVKAIKSNNETARQNSTSRQENRAQIADTLKPEYAETKNQNKRYFKKTSSKKQFKLVRSTATYDEYEAIKTDRYIVKKISKKTVKKSNISAKLSRKKNKVKTFSQQTKIKNKIKTLPKISSNKFKIEEVSLKNKAIITEAINLQLKDTMTKTEVLTKKKKEIQRNKIPKDTTLVTTEISERSLNHFLSIYYGPSTYKSHGNGNSLFSNSSDYVFTSKTNYNFGFYARVMFNDHIGIRTGIGQTVSNQEMLQKKSGTQFIDVSNISLDRNTSITALEDQFKSQTQVIFEHNLSFIEVPLEAYFQYAPNKIGIAFAIGGSYLFIKKDEVFLKSQNINAIKIGSSNNLSNTTFSANFQMFLTYKISNRFQIEAGPQYKYHFQTADRTTNYKPYFLNFYGGFSYKL